MLAELQAEADKLTDLLARLRMYRQVLQLTVQWKDQLPRQYIDAIIALDPNAKT